LARFLLDTSTLVDFSQGREPVTGRLLERLGGPDEFGVCAVVLAEFFTGVQQADIDRWRGVTDRLRFWQADPRGRNLGRD
jgi:predicted nucleic acid-binding protein